MFSKDNEISTADFKERHIKQEPTYQAQNYLNDGAVGQNQEEIFVEDEATHKESWQTLHTWKKTHTVATET